MSRRKQAKPRAVKRDEVDEVSSGLVVASAIGEQDTRTGSPLAAVTAEASQGTCRFFLMPATGAQEEVLKREPPGTPVAMETENSLESGLNGVCGLGTPTSWRSSDTPDDQSLSPSTTPASEPDADLSYTIGVTENTPYACQFCDKAFPRLSYLKRHEQVHGDQMPFRCDFCQRLFKHKRSRDRHVKLHTGDRKYRCPHCESAFSRSDHLKIHLKTHDNAKPYQCTVCNRGYNTAAALTSHMQNHKKADSTAHHNGHHAPSASGTNGGHQQGYRCLECAAVFPTARELQEHGASSHRRDVSPSSSPANSEGAAVPCSLCPTLCASGEALRLHRDQCHPSSTTASPEIGFCAPCAHCKETFISPLDLQRHLKVHESSTASESASSSPGLACTFCPRSDFGSPESLQSHIARRHHHGRRQALQNRNYRCDYCGLQLPSVHSLQKHTLGAHSFADLLQKTREYVYCSQCTRSFISSAELTEHVRDVHEAEHSKTDDASREATPKANGKTADVKPLQIDGVPIFNGGSPRPLQSALLCSQCNAGFPDFESFRTHLRSHLDACKTPTAATPLMQRKLSCPECEGEFSNEEQLDFHLTSHFLSSSTEYGCQSCLKSFAQPDELQRHLFDSHALQLFRCALCQELFDSKVAVQVHFAVKHSNECRLLRCTSCSAAFRTELEFQVHVRTAHLAKVHPYRCLLCDQSYATEVQLSFHLASHKKPFACTLCDEAFHVEFLLDKHMASRHTAPSANQLTEVPAPVPEVTPQNLSLKGRSRGEEEKDAASGHHRCDICDATLGSESALNAHRRQAHNIRVSGNQRSGAATLSLYCAYCNESCKSRTDLENHMKAHTVSPSKHKCNICDELCPSATTLAEHKLTHCKLVTSNSCVICKANLTGEEQFYGHVQQHHCQGRPLSCVVCRQTLASDVEVHLHAKFHLKQHGEPILLTCCVCARPHEASRLIITGKIDSGAHTYMCKECFHTRSAAVAAAVAEPSPGISNINEGLRCDKCQVKFESLSELEIHRRNRCTDQQPQQKTYQCIKCQMSFETEEAIQLHVASHVIQEGTEHDCRLCRKVFDSPAKLQCHLIEHTFEGCSTYTCYLCSAVFTAPHLVQQHMLEHGLNARPYDCDRCHQKFFFRAELEHHAVSHGEERILLCPECGKSFSSAGNLKSHRKSHHQHQNRSSPAVQQTNGPLKCSLCNMVCHSSVEMQQHYYAHHSASDIQDAVSLANSFPCGDCGKAFPCLSNLQGHQRTHRQGSRFACPQCPKEFSLSRNLHIHLRSHSGEKPYGCPMCPKRFARKENRKAHLKSHAGLKPFMCPHCGKTFSRKCHVKEHMRTHITSTTHPCELCTETFASTRLLRRHLVDVHQRTFEHTCSVCGDVFERSAQLEGHLSRAHDVTTTRSVDDDDNELLYDDDETFSSSSSSAADCKELDSSDCSSVAGEEHASPADSANVDVAADAGAGDDVGVDADNDVTMEQEVEEKQNSASELSETCS